MRPSSYDAQTLRQLLYQRQMATLPEMMQALGTHVSVTVFRKLKPLDYLTSYSHRGRFTLFGTSPVSTTTGCGPAKAYGFLATALC